MKNASQLIEILNNALRRTKDLQEYNYLPIVENNEGLLEKIIGLKNIDHWDFIKDQIINLMESQQYRDALNMINIALNHLQTKTKWILENGKPAFSNLAVMSEIGSKVPVIGKFFPDIMRNAHYQGINKTQLRLELINSWLTKLEEHFTPTLLSEVKNGANTILEMIMPKDKSEEEEKSDNNNNYAMMGPKR